MITIDSTVRSNAVCLLKELVATNSVNPPGNEASIAELIAGRLEETGIEVRRIPLETGRVSLTARIPGRKSGCTVICAHLDTVAPGGDGWLTNPLVPRCTEDRLWGLGSADMKAGLAATLCIAEQCVQQGQLPVHDLVLALTADEEGAYRGAGSVVKSGEIDDIRMLIIPEPTGGWLYTGQKGELWMTVRFRGKAAHGSIPEAGINAVLPAARFCDRLTMAALEFPDVAGRGRTSVNIGKFEGGWQVNVVPDLATLSIDVRTVSSEDRERMLALVQTLGRECAQQAGASYEVDVFNDRAPIVSDVEDPFVEAFIASANEVAGKAVPTGIAPYSTDAVEIVPVYGVPVVIYGPGRIEEAHQPNESVSLASLDRVMKTMAQFLFTDHPHDSDALPEDRYPRYDNSSQLSSEAPQQTKM